jgi:hypothetical protein
MPRIRAAGGSAGESAEPPEIESPDQNRTARRARLCQPRDTGQDHALAPGPRTGVSPGWRDTALRAARRLCSGHEVKTSAISARQ